MMNKNLFKNLLRKCWPFYLSLRLKILLGFIVAGVLSALILFYSIGSIMGGFRSQFNHIITESIDYYLDEIGEPPSLETAKYLSERFSVGIRFQSADTAWATSQELPTLEVLKTKNSNFFGLRGRYYKYRHGDEEKYEEYERKRHHWNKGPNKFVPKLRVYHSENTSYLYWIVRRNTGQFVFFLNPDQLFDDEHKWYFGALWLLPILFLIAYFWLKQLLKPIQTLQQVTKKVQSGQLEFQIPNKRKDELGQLVQSFNQMLVKLKELFQSKKQLLLDAGHELRTPITRIKLRLEFLKNEEHKKLLVEDLQILEKMIQNLLEDASLDSGFDSLQMHQFNLSQWLEKQTLNYEKKQLDLKLIGPPVWLVGDEEKLRILFKNLVDNALVHSEAQPTITITEIQTEKWVGWSIEDQGIGIPEKDQQHIFEPFYRVDKARTPKTAGFGLGLSICKKIVDAHLGQLHLQSAEQQGTTVTIHLPKNLNS